MKKLCIDDEKLRRNLRTIRDYAKGAPVIGVLSCDAYGLGLVQCARLLWSENVRFFAVDTARDALELRHAGLTEADILLTHSTTDREETEMLLDASAIATVGSQDAAMALNGLAERRAAIAEAHIKVDTGAGQYGFLPTETDKIESVYRNLQSIAVSGVYTTLIPGAPGKILDTQAELFQSVLGALGQKGLETGLVHMVDSCSLMRRQSLPCHGAVRVDGALSGRAGVRGPLVRVGFIESQVSEIMWLPKGFMLGSAGKTRRPTRIGVIPVGYGDGFSMERSARGLWNVLRSVRRGKRPFAYVGDEKVHVIGTIEVNHVVVDLTNSNCSVGAYAYLDVDPLFCSGLTREYTGK